MKTYGRATLRGKTWRIEAEPHVVVFVKRLWKKAERGIPGRVDVANSDEVCADLRWISSRYPLTFEPAGALERGCATYDARRERVDEILTGKANPERFKLAKPAREYQARSAELVLEQGYVLVADEVGLGKTVTAIAAMMDPATRPALVVTLAHLPGQWAEKLAEFAPGLTVHVLQRATPYTLPEFFGRSPDVIVTNYHKLPGWAEFLAKHVRYVVFDEIQELRHTGTAKHDAATVIARGALFRMGLSATPVYNYGGEIFSVCEVLKHGVLGTKTEFLAEWCEPAASGKFKLREPKAFGSWARDRGLIVRHTREEVGRELPEIQNVVQTVEADERAMERIEKSAASLAERYLATAGVSGIQRAEAGATLDAIVRQATGLAKAAAVGEFVRLLVESGERVLLYGWHHAVYDAWTRALEGLRVARFTGEESAAEKARVADEFVKGRVDVLIMSLRSGAGLDGLQVASSVVVFGELDWSPGVHEQCIGRLRRDGQTKNVLAYYLTANTGSDPIVLDVLGVKRAQVQGIVDPKGSVLHVVETDGSRIRKLAETYLRTHGGAPAPAPVRSSDFAVQEF